MLLSHKGKQLEGQPVSVQVLILAGALLVVAASGVAVQGLAVPVQRLLEGYWPWPFRALSHRLVERISSKAHQIEARWQELAQRVFSGTASAAERAEFTILERRRRRIPYDHSVILPTRLGNTLRAANLNSLGKYGLDPVLLWPYLRQLLPEQARRDFEDAQRALSLNISVIIWAVSFMIFQVFNWWPVLVGLALAFSAFIFTPRRAENLADLAEVMWDLYRVELYKRLRWPLPANPQEERQAGSRLTAYLVRGLGGTQPTFVDEGSSGKVDLTSSVSGNDVYCLCFRIFALSCRAWSTLVRLCPSPWAAVVTQLVTQAAFFSGILPDGLSLSAQPLCVGAAETTPASPYLPL